MALENGTELLHYRIVEKIGEGGMGAVYRATDRKLEREVAIKVLPRTMAADPSRLERFRREARAVAALNHPHIVTLFSVEQEGDTHFLTMELVEGQSLDRDLPPGGLPLARVLDIGEALADALASAHEKGIVHRDLKPANVMLSKDSRVKVLDFGLAKLSEDAAQPHRAGNLAATIAATAALSLTQPGMAMGTAPYMSPEQLEGRAVDQRTDIFALGVILYEMCTGTRPFQGETAASLISAIMRDPPRPLNELRQGIPRHLGRIVDHCLQKLPGDRYQSALDVRNELRGLRRELDSGGWTSGNTAVAPIAAGAGSGSPSLSVPLPAVSAPGGGPATVAGSADRTAKHAILFAGVLGLAGLAFGVYRLWSQPGVTPEQAPASQPVKISTLMSRDNLLTATLSPDGRYLAYATSDPPTYKLTVRQVRTGSDINIISDSPRPIQHLRFSGDGDYLFYTNRDPNLPNYHALFQVASLGGEARKIAFDVDSAPAFAPDGNRFVFRRGIVNEDADSLILASLESEEERELIRIQTPQRYKGDPSWSPDGEHVAILTQTSGGTLRSWIQTVSISDGAGRVVGDPSWLDVDSVVWGPGGKFLLATAFSLGGGIGQQIYRVPFPSGPVARLTADVDDYTNLSLSSDGAILAAVRRSNVSNVWLSPAGGEASPITFAVGSSEAVLSVAALHGGKVAFTAPRDSSVVLWSMDADGSNRRQLSTQEGFVTDLEYQAAAGVVYTRLSAEQGAHVWRWTPDHGPNQLTRGGGEMLLGLSPVGNAIIFSSFGDAISLNVQSLDGREPYLLTADPRTESAATFLPDGRRVLVTMLEGETPSLYPQRYVLPLEGGEPVAVFRLPPGATSLNFVPGTDDDLTYIDRESGWNLMRRSIHDEQAKPVTRFDSGQIVDYSWHPDGSRLAVHHRLGRTDSLWELETGATELRKIVEFKTGRIFAHNWSPDTPDLYFRYGTITQDVVLIGN